MDARLLRWLNAQRNLSLQQKTLPASVSLACAKAAMLAVVLLASMGAQQRSANFIVEASDAAFARQVSDAAEKYRRDLAVEWTGEPMPNWSQPCVMTVSVGPRLEACGATTFVFSHGEVYDWRMKIQGSRERLLDSVLPHEITHMVYACRFRRPLPRWADEGGATSIEHVSERSKYLEMLPDMLRGNRGIAFNRMFSMMEYPPDFMALYAQGYSLAEYLIQKGGRRKYVEFIADGLKTDDWGDAIERNYGIRGLGNLQNNWVAWVQQGSPALTPNPPAPGEMIASNRRPRPEPNLIYHTAANAPANESAARDGLRPLYRDSEVTPATAVTRNDAAGKSGEASQVLPASGWVAVNTANAAPPRPLPPPARLPAPLPTLSMSSPRPLPAPAAYAKPSADPFLAPTSTQVAHPQPIGSLSQTVEP